MTAIATTHWAGHPAPPGTACGQAPRQQAPRRQAAARRGPRCAPWPRAARRHGGHRGYGPGQRLDRPRPLRPGGFGPFGRGGRGKRARRGDVRAAILLLLDEEPRNGYQLMQEIEERSEGVWRPSPGSVYPALQQLEDEGLVRSDETDGRRAFQLTDAGRTYVEENREALGSPVGRGRRRPARGPRRAAQADDAARHGHHAGRPGRRRGPDRRGPQGPRGRPPLAVPDPRRRRRRRARGGLAVRPRGAPSPPQRAAQRPPPRLERAPRAQLLAQRAGRQPWQAGARRALQRAALARLDAAGRARAACAPTAAGARDGARGRARRAPPAARRWRARRAGAAATSPTTLAAVLDVVDERPVDVGQLARAPARTRPASGRGRSRRARPGRAARRRAPRGARGRPRR